MFEQIKALFLLKIAIMRNQRRRGQVVSDIFRTLFLVFALLGACGLGIGCFFLGFFMTKTQSSVDIVLVFTDIAVGIYLFFILVGFLTELHVTEVLDFKKMMYLPISLKMVFLMNMLMSLIAASTIFLVMELTGFILGAAFSIGPRILPGIFLIFVFLWMIGAWLYFIKSWLAILLENKRRRRTVAALAGLLFVLLGQLPNLANMYFNVGRHSNNPGITTAKNPYQAYLEENFWLARGGALEDVNRIVPFGWLPLGLNSLSSGKYGTVAMSLLGMTAMGFIGFSLGYRATLKYHAGGGAKGMVAIGRKEASVKVTSSKQPLTMIKLSYVDDETSAITTASFITILRHPQQRMQMLSPIFIIFIILIITIFQAKTLVSPPLGVKYYIAIIIALIPLLGTIMFLLNSFGVDMAGFRAYVLSPVPRWKILLGKNLSVVPFVLVMIIVFLLVLNFFIHIGFSITVMALLAAAQIFLLQAAIGNYISIFFPYPCSFDQIRGRKVSNQSLISALLFMVTSGFLLLPVGLCYFSPFLLQQVFSIDLWYVGICFSTIFLAFLIFLYGFLLRSSGHLLEKREMIVLQKLASDK